MDEDKFSEKDTQQGGFEPEGYRQNFAQSGALGQNPAPVSGEYRWSNPNYAPHPQEKKRSAPHGGFFRKACLVLACCILSSSLSVAGFFGLVKGGFISVSASSQQSSDTMSKLLGGAVSSAAGTDSSTAVSTVVSDSAAVTQSDAALTFQQVAQKLIPSVVCIQNYQSSTGFGLTQASSVSPAGEGSGVIISADGYILTCAHVVADATSLKAVLSDGTTVEADLVGYDSLTDIAVVKIDQSGLSAVELGSYEALQVADAVMAVGNPGGLAFSSSVTIGYVSALNREMTDSDTGYTMHYIQTDAAINPGNSGGALVDSNGRLVGINSSKIVADGYEGLGFAIPVDTAMDVAQDLMAYGYVKDRPDLGVTGQFIDSFAARFYGLTRGVYVTSVNSQEASDAGLKKGDVITSVDGTQVTSYAVLTAAVNEKLPGDTVVLQVYRASSGAQTELSVVLAQSTGQ